MLWRHPLVAEELAELVDVLEAADDRPLQVQLGRDPQEEVAVERVVVGLERARRCAAGHPLQDRRFHLDVAALVEVVADRRHDLGPHREDLARALVRHQVELALTVADLGVGDAVEEVGWVAQRLCKQHALAHLERQLAALGHVEIALDPDQVADVEVFDPVERLLSERVDASVGLDRAGEVADVEERRLAVAALPGHPAGDPVGELAVLALPQLVDPVSIWKGEGVGVDPFRPQALGLCEALGLGVAGRGLSARGRVSHGSTVLADRESRAQGAMPTVTRSPPI